MNYPRKAKKKPPDCKHVRTSGLQVIASSSVFETLFVSAQFAVAVVESTEEGVPVFLIRQRPETGSSGSCPVV